MQPPPPPPKKPGRVDTQELKARLVKRLGTQRAELYLRSLKRFFAFQLGKEEFDKICTALLGDKENVRLHNTLLKAILRNAYTAAAPPTSRRAATGNSQTSTVSNGTTLNGGVQLPARRVRPATTTRERRFDKPSPLGKSPFGHPGAAATGSKSLLEVISVEDGEEVDQAQGSPVCVQSRSPIRAPLGVVMAQNSQPLTLCNLDVCYNNGELPDSESLLKLLEEKLKDLGLSMPRECADVLNSGLNVYLSQMLKACLGVAKARRGKATMRPPNGASAAGQHHCIPAEAGCSYQASLLDLWTAVQSNARLAACAQQREKISSHLLNR